MKPILFFIVVFCGLIACKPNMTKTPNLKVIAYYNGTGEDLNNYDFSKIDQVIFSFLYLDGNKLEHPNPEKDKALKNLLKLKTTHPNIEILVSLGGWGGCETCSEVFSSDKGRKEFSQSTLDLLKEYKVDGIDLDWEYPAIEGHPGHPFKPEDKHNFTLLIQELRKTLGDSYVLSFAAGGYDEYLESSIEWELVMPLVNNVNLMSYDLKNGFSTITGHHTPIYSNKNQKQSTHNAIEFFKKRNIDLSKVVIGAAFYARIWENVAPKNNGLYQEGKFKSSVNFKELNSYLEGNDFFEYYDSISKAPYGYSPSKKLFITYDNKLSVQNKTQYAIEQKLGGIMFWELKGDYYKKGLLNSIHKTIKK